MHSKPKVPQKWSWDWWLDFNPVVESPPQVPSMPSEQEALENQDKDCLFGANTGTGTPSGANPLQLLLEFRSIAGANKDSWRNAYGLIWNQVRRRSLDRVCLRYIRRLCQRYGQMSERGVVHPEEVANLDAELRAHLVKLEDIPAFIKNQRGSQHENVVRFIYGKYFIWFGSTRFQIDIMKSSRIAEQNKDTYSKVMKTLLSRVKHLLETIEEEGAMMGVSQVQDAQKQDSPSQALKYF